MQSTIPSTSEVMSALLKADFTIQWRNRRGVIMVILVPVIIVITWKGLIEKFGGAFVLSNCITVGLNAIGLMGYSNAIARDRDKGVFQRLRVAPVRTGSIMISRLSVQLVMILLMSSAVFMTGAYYDKIILPTGGYLLGMLMAVLGGALYLALAQTIVGLIKNAETVSSTTRLVYFIFIMIGMFGELGALGKDIGAITRWSPYGVVKHLLASGMQPNIWDRSSSLALVVTLGYTLLFSMLGIKWFRWNAR